MNYRFHDGHPFHPIRLELTMDLLRELGALTPQQMHLSRPATDEELLWIHQPAYLEAVKQLSRPSPEADWITRGEQFGLLDEDTPYFPGMHDAAAWVVGGTITAVEAVLSGSSTHALHLGGGLHHALSARAAGFCVYNDARWPSTMPAVITARACCTSTRTSTTETGSSGASIRTLMCAPIPSMRRANTCSRAPASCRSEASIKVMALA
ncbi:hypothetical protein HMSSN139_03460 [Paenibacillus sp. HMSSN-139]|nr:hypothetical protein HMSSN139_03460 [Paenibacillus sp. HMSSN-139]